MTVGKIASSTGVHILIPKVDSDWVYLEHVHLWISHYALRDMIDNLRSYVPTLMANGNRAV